MRVLVLGTAAGGGLPQWNCSCVNCTAVRAGSPGIKPRTQSSVAISADGNRWFLLNASPDLPAQFAANPALHPPLGSGRSTSVEGVLLTNADLDHTLGLFGLREGGTLRVFATAAVRRTLTSGISAARVLESFCGLEWILPPAKLLPLPCRDDSPSGLCYQAIPLVGGPPRYFRNGAFRQDARHSIGYRLVDARTGARFLFLPDVARIDRALAAELLEADVVLFDGTFWSENEMVLAGVGRASAKQMGHLPISGRNGSLRRLASLPARRKVYVHLNNTNPVLRENSKEAQEVRASGVEVGLDGTEITL